MKSHLFAKHFYAMVVLVLFSTSSFSLAGEMKNTYELIKSYQLLMLNPANYDSQIDSLLSENYLNMPNSGAKEEYLRPVVMANVIKLAGLTCETIKDTFFSDKEDYQLYSPYNKEAFKRGIINEQGQYLNESGQVANPNSPYEWNNDDPRVQKYYQDDEKLGIKKVQANNLKLKSGNYDYSNEKKYIIKFYLQTLNRKPTAQELNSVFNSLDFKLISETFPIYYTPGTDSIEVLYTQHNEMALKNICIKLLTSHEFLKSR